MRGPRPRDPTCPCSRARWTRLVTPSIRPSVRSATAPRGTGKGRSVRGSGRRRLLTGRARGYSDGYIYSIIRYGRGVMPRYGDKVYLPSDRWAIVNHLRKLQGASPAPQEPAGAAVGIPPAPSATGSTSARPR